MKIHRELFHLQGCVEFDVAAVDFCSEVTLAVCEFDIAGVHLQHHLTAVNFCQFNVTCLGVDIHVLTFDAANGDITVSQADIHILDFLAFAEHDDVRRRIICRQIDLHVRTCLVRFYR